LFSEFGRRVHDNGSGTDHGAAGVAFVLGEKVQGRHFGEMPSLKRNIWFRAIQPEYGFPLHLLNHPRKVAGLEPGADRHGTFEQPAFLNYREAPTAASSPPSRAEVLPKLMRANSSGSRTRTVDDEGRIRR